MHRYIIKTDGIRVQTCRDLLDTPIEILNVMQNRITNEGWGKKLLEKRDPQTEMWAMEFIPPKWTSTHYTLLEALRDYEINGYRYRLADIHERTPKAWEFILRKKLFRSVCTGEVIHPTLLMLSYPCRWQYDILRCMDYFASVQKDFDSRMKEALALIIQKKRKSNHWPVQHKHSGMVHFDMEKTGEDSRWNTLRVLRVLRFYKPETYQESITWRDRQELK